MIRIIVVDGQEEYRNYLCEYLSNQRDFEVAGAGKDSYEAVKLVDTHKPDVVIMDINLPLGDGVKTAALIKYRSPATQVIINWDGQERRIFSVFFSGISGCITRHMNSDLLCHAIRAVYYGGSLVAPEIALKFKTIVSGLTGNVLKSRGELRAGKAAGRRARGDHPGDDKTLPRTVSPSEIRIMGYVGRGCTNREIAEILCLTEGTVRNYISSVLQKTGFRDRTQVAIYAVKAGL
jgi:DNA-binding NarL/FixJ family response regulator